MRERLTCWLVAELSCREIIEETIMFSVLFGILGLSSHISVVLAEYELDKNALHIIIPSNRLIQSWFAS